MCKFPICCLLVVGTTPKTSSGGGGIGYVVVVVIRVFYVCHGCEVCGGDDVITKAV